MSMSSSSSKIPTPVLVNSDDLTLAELDRATKLAADDETVGTMTALAYVFLKREHPAVRLADVKALRFRDVTITSDDELAAEGDTTEQVAADPTN